MQKVKIPFLVVLLYILTFGLLSAQSGSDTISGDNVKNKTTIGGYGSIYYKRDFKAKYSTVYLERIALVARHKFSDKISFFSELELNKTTAEWRNNGGDVAIDEAYLKFSLNSENYIVGGIFTPSIGILNENHLPTSYFGNERNQVETYVIPTTWSEAGIGYYGKLSRLPLNFSLCLVNGLDAQGFSHYTGIKNGLQQDKVASANNLALNASLQYTYKNLKLRASTYYGGSNVYSSEYYKTKPDSVKLKTGVFALPVVLLQGNIQYMAKGIRATLLGSVVNIKDAFDINKVYGDSIPKTLYGIYGEIGYNIFETLPRFKGQQLIAFLRYERLDMNQQAPDNGYLDRNLDREHLVFGLNYLPIKNVVIKADFRYLHTTNINAAKFSYLTLGAGYSF